MTFHVPDSIITGLTGFIVALLGAGTTILWGIKDKRFPLDWRSKKMDAQGNYLTSQELSDRLHEHCSKRQVSLDGTLKDINAILMEIRERLARLEGAYGADHK